MPLRESILCFVFIYSRQKLWHYSYINTKWLPKTAKTHIYILSYLIYSFLLQINYYKSYYSVESFDTATSLSAMLTFFCPQLIRWTVRLCCSAIFSISEYPLYLESVQLYKYGELPVKISTAAYFELVSYLSHHRDTFWSISVNVGHAEETKDQD